MISMDRNKFFWNTSFPSLTVCPHKRIDDAKLEEYMKFVSLSFVCVCDDTNQKTKISRNKNKKRTEKMDEWKQKIEIRTNKKWKKTLQIS